MKRALDSAPTIPESLAPPRPTENPSDTDSDVEEDSKVRAFLKDPVAKASLERMQRVLLWSDERDELMQDLREALRKGSARY